MALLNLPKPGRLGVTREIRESMRRLEEFQRIAVEDLKAYIVRIEKRMDTQDTVLRAIENFQRVATEDLKRQISSVESRLDSGAVEGPHNLTDIRSELASIRQNIDRQALGMLRLLDRREAR